MVVFKVGNGNKIRFWEDVWVGENSLQALFPSLFRYLHSSLVLSQNFSFNQVCHWGTIGVGTYTSGTC